ncbi:MAG: hypothetical protein R2695_02800 [Acidimicrobiales bacterium]
MKAIRITEGEPALVDVATPPPGADGADVRVRVASVGICGSDLPHDRHRDGRGPDPRPRGGRPSRRRHRGRAGTVSILRDVRSLRDRRPQPLRGRGRRAGGVPATAMAEYVRVPAAALVALAPGVSVADASLVENLAVAVHAVNAPASTSATA